MKQITVIETNNLPDFEKLVNAYLKSGWELHGDPQISVTSHQDSYAGRLRSWSQKHYSQCLKKEV